LGFLHKKVHSPTHYFPSITLFLKFPKCSLNWVDCPRSSQRAHPPIGSILLGVPKEHLNRLQYSRRSQRVPRRFVRLFSRFPKKVPNRLLIRLLSGFPQKVPTRLLRLFSGFPKKCPIGYFYSSRSSPKSSQSVTLICSRSSPPPRPQSSQWVASIVLGVPHRFQLSHDIFVLCVISSLFCFPREARPSRSLRCLRRDAKFFCRLFIARIIDGSYLPEVLVFVVAVVVFLQD
jgi:hypothetical protein